MGNTQYIAFNLGNDVYATSILTVQEIINRMDTIPIPEAPEYILGVIDFRENVIPVIDLKKKLSLHESGIKEDAKILILNLDNMLFGGLVDKVIGVINVDEDEIKTQLTAFNSNVKAYISGFVKSDEQVYKLLNFNYIVTPEDMMAVKTNNEKDAFYNLSNMNDLPHICETYFNTQMDEKLIKPSMNDEDFQAMTEVAKRIQKFLDLIANGELTQAEEVLREIAHFGEQKPIAEIKRITDSLHNSLNEFKKLLTPEVKNIVAEDMPEAQDKLQWVINKTEEAVSQTIKLVEKNLDIQSDIVKRLDIIDAALKKSEDTTDEEREAMEFLRNALEGMNTDLMELLLIQEYQDLTGQIIKKVIELTATLERELSNLIKLFGKTEPVKKEERIEKQDDLDQLLSEFGL